MIVFKHFEILSRRNELIKSSKQLEYKNLREEVIVILQKEEVMIMVEMMR